MSKLVVQLVTWNGGKYIPHLFDSLRKQTYTNFHLYILDNGSTDETSGAIEKELKNFSIDYTFIINKNNAGFAGGHNQVFRNTSGNEYVLLLNQDMYLMPECIEQMVQFLDTHETVAAVSPRLMRWDFARIEQGLEKSFTHSIDSLGLRVFRNRRVIEKYAGKIWEDKQSKLELSFRTHENAMKVFGVSGALPMFRRSALDAVTFSDGTFFDESYQSYKEDVDLAYRLRIAGFDACVLLDSAAYHDRSAAGLERLGDRVAAENKKKQSAWVKYHSYKNHLMTLYKNEYRKNFTLDFPWILWYECKKFIYFLIFDRSVLAGLGEIYHNRAHLKSKRKEIVRMRKITPTQLRVWWK